MYTLFELEAMPTEQLVEVAKSMNLKKIDPENREELAFSIIDQQALDKASSAKQNKKDREQRQGQNEKSNKSSNNDKESESSQQSSRRNGRKKKEDQTDSSSSISMTAEVAPAKEAADVDNSVSEGTKESPSPDAANESTTGKRRRG
ncbi:MAG: Rho termination factor N-terminal domain-containing protein, partial [Muribaculaceae bacterium]|nr:Rho termination factor N-terminal domain-containing protein [Muribaculaceae bacterium]